jgi:hypothetical protein
LNATKFKIIKSYLTMRDFLATGYIGRQADGGIEAIRRRIEAEGDGRVKPIRVPWRDTNKALGHGLTPGQTSIVVGSAGAAKSYLTLNILLAAGRSGLRWKLLPTEDDGGRWIQRALAVHCCDWSLVAQPANDTEDERRRLADAKLAALDGNPELVAELYESILENPRLPIDDGNGGKTVPDLAYQDVLLFLEQVALDCDIVAVDCLSQIDFSQDGRDYVGQSDFMRKIVGIAASTGVHIVLVGHHGKGGGDKSNMDRIQGTSLFNRLAHNLLELARSDPSTESEVYSRMVSTVEHRLTLSILKCRGGASGDKIAFDLHEHGPQFIEHGRIKKAKGRK